jgi:ribonuclease P protein component
LEPTLVAFPRSHRLTRASEFDAMRQGGVRVAGRLPDLDVRAAPSGRPHPRVGLIVPKYKHTSVDRNRLKRRLRELVRTRLLPTLPPIDLVVRAFPSAYSADLAGLADQIGRVRRAIDAP